MGKDYSSTMDYPLGQHLRELPGPLLLTGHTGFKGTWMTFLLEQLNVPVVGYSLPAEKDSLFDRAERIGTIPEEFSDIRDYQTLERFIDEHKPSTIIHMAAQPLVLKSYESPRETFDVNVMGTVNILDIAFRKEFVRGIIIVTTDKVYRNDNSGRAFIETDPLEGKDPYSASKVGTEAVVSAWQQIAKVSGGPRVVSVRAGNVIGGGDFAVDRLVPDIIRGAITGNPIEIRNPKSSRPWQHVLDPLLGYVCMLESLATDSFVRSMNFGPSSGIITVENAAAHLKDVLQQHNNVKFKISGMSDSNFEAENLCLDSTLAGIELDWKPLVNGYTAIEMTGQWWNRVLNYHEDPYKACMYDISFFMDIYDQE
jgi:CDP-glucose 4,6-dehydratase